MKKQGLRRWAVIWGLALLIWLAGGAALALATVSDYQRHIIACGWGYCWLFNRMAPSGPGGLTPMANWPWPHR